MTLNFTNPAAQARVTRMQELLRAGWMTRQHLAAELGMTARAVEPGLNYLIAFGGIEVKTRNGKTQWFHCRTPNIVTFNNERKDAGNARYIAAKAADVQPFRDSLTMAFFWTERIMTETQIAAERKAFSDIYRKKLMSYRNYSDDQITKRYAPDQFAGWLLRADQKSPVKRRAYFGTAHHKDGLTFAGMVVASDALTAFRQFQADACQTIGDRCTIGKFEFVEELPEIE